MASATRPRRGKLVHVTEDYRVTLCGKQCDGWVLQVDELPTCQRCLRHLAGLG